METYDKELYTKYKASKVVKGSKIEAWSNLVRKWIIKLGLQDEPIFPLFEEKGDNVFTLSKVTWNPFNKYWEIHYKYPQKKHTIIHELGHIYLDKLSDSLEYKKNLNLIKADNKQLHVDAGVLEDVFVEKELGKFSEVREIQWGRARREKKVFKLMQLVLISPHYKYRVSFIRKALIKSKKYSLQEINKYLKLKYGKLYRLI